MPVDIASFVVGADRLTLFAGPCVIESARMCLEIAAA
ncbi:MAG: 3-deoxy-7-phosphoheptulonate synthase, partial [Planctomycetota bacterium]